MEFIVFGLVPVLLLALRNFVGVILFVVYLLFLMRLYGDDVAIGNVIACSVLIAIVSFAIWVVSLPFRK